VNKELIINAAPQGVEIALMEDRKLVELHSEKSDARFAVGDLYLGKVKKLIPGLNAAFIDVGFEKDAFLHYTDLSPYARSLLKFTNMCMNDKSEGGIDFGKFEIEPEIIKTGKINEVLGLKSSAFSVEYFCHSPLFSLTHKDIVIIFSSTNRKINEKANRLNFLLKKHKFYSFLIEIPFDTNMDIVFFSSFFVQLFVYGLAKEKKLKNCYFLENKELLNISSDLIY